MRPSKRLERIPPYLFAQLERKIAEKKAQGIDVISLGIGDPDTPTPALVVDALRDAAGDPSTHQYPSNRGREEFRAAVAYVLRGGESPVTVHLDGGDLEVEVGEDLHVTLTGWARRVYAATLSEEFVEELNETE